MEAVRRRCGAVGSHSDQADRQSPVELRRLHYSPLEQKGYMLGTKAEAPRQAPPRAKRGLTTTRVPGLAVHIDH